MSNVKFEGKLGVVLDQDHPLYPEIENLVLQAITTTQKDNNGSVIHTHKGQPRQHWEASTILDNQSTVTLHGSAKDQFDKKLIPLTQAVTYLSQIQIRPHIIFATADDKNKLELKQIRPTELDVLTLTHNGHETVALDSDVDTIEALLPTILDAITNS